MKRNIVFYYVSLTALLLTACKQVNDPAKAHVHTPVYNLAFANQQLAALKTNLVVKDHHLVAITGWEPYTAVKQQVAALDTLPAEQGKHAIAALRETFNEFKNTLPSYLRLDDVQDALEDLEKELAILESFLAPKITDTTMIQRQVLELQQSFAYLQNRVLLMQARYADGTQKSATAYRNQLNDYSVYKTTAFDLQKTETLKDR